MNASALSGTKLFSSKFLYHNGGKEHKRHVLVVEYLQRTRETNATKIEWNYIIVSAKDLIKRMNQNAYINNVDEAMID